MLCCFYHYKVGRVAISRCLSVAGEVVCNISAMEKTIMQVQAKTIVTLVCSIAAAFLIATAFTVVGSQPAKALPAYAQATGKACGFCHVSPGGGGALKDAGKKFQANGHKL